MTIDSAGSCELNLPPGAIVAALDATGAEFCRGRITHARWRGPRVAGANATDFDVDVTLSLSLNLLAGGNATVRWPSGGTSALLRGKFWHERPVALERCAA